ncbi:uncharacterized protein LOC143238497 [Tachypleus tridentatus]|uniref:uncharacterized protein LOC143238497 n=1 Tax=Tachypleus tridentatus TaxID=6853 RepID=UPI003FD5E785
MRPLVCVFLLLGIYVAAEEREKRQAGYQLPGQRSTGNQGASGLYQAPQRQFQAQPVQAYSPPRGSPRRQAVAGPQYGSIPQQSLDGGGEEEEKPTTPDPLSLLLADSKFHCSGKKDGYYADDSVNCRVFHYCVAGTSHSWMCPVGTVFHQVHLNCVPSNQDICDRSEKFHVVNDYLYKPIDYDGPNKTARYYKRYYPEEFLRGPPSPTQFGFPAAPPGESVSQPVAYGGEVPASRPVPRPSSYGNAPSRQTIAYVPQQSSRPAHQSPPSRHTSSGYSKLPQAPQLPQVPSIPRSQLHPQEDDDSRGRRPIRYNPNVYGAPPRPQGASPTYRRSGVQYDDE